jgi:hypothetical protein
MFVSPEAYLQANETGSRQCRVEGNVCLTQSLLAREVVTFRHVLILEYLELLSRGVN